jgi:hypothetical protein
MPNEIRVVTPPEYSARSTYSLGTGPPAEQSAEYQRFKDLTRQLVESDPKPSQNEH